MPKVFPSLVLVSLTILGCRSADTGLAAFIPADTVALAGIRMDQLRATPVYQKLRAQKRLSELDDLKARTGFDPTSDVSEMLIAANGKEGVTIARGHFNPTDAAAQKSTYKGYTLYAHGAGAYALIDPTTVIAGSAAGVRSAIDQYKSGARSPAVASLLERAKIIPAQNQIWAVADSADAFSGLATSGNAANFGKIFGQIERLTFSADLSQGIKAFATGECRTDQDAKSLGDALRGLISLGKLSVAQGQTDLLRLYDSVQLDQEQKTLKVALRVPPDLVDKLMELTTPRQRSQTR